MLPTKFHRFHIHNFSCRLTEGKLVLVGKWTELIIPFYVLLLKTYLLIKITNLSLIIDSNQICPWLLIQIHNINRQNLQCNLIVSLYRIRDENERPKTHMSYLIYIGHFHIVFPPQHILEVTNLSMEQNNPPLKLYI